MKYYNKDDIRQDMRRDIAVNSAYIAAWEKVTFPTKKDGSPFKVMSKNIDGASYEMESHAMQAGEYVLTVYCGFNSAVGYVHDTIRAHELVRYLKDDAMKAKTENYQPKVAYLEQVYTYDLEDIKKAVSDRIAYLKAYNEELEKQLAKLDKVFDTFRAAYDSAIEQLKQNTSEFSHSNLYHAVKDCVLSRYPYV